MAINVSCRAGIVWLGIDEDKTRKKKNKRTTTDAHVEHDIIDLKA